MTDKQKLTLEYVNKAEHIITSKGEIRICCPNCDDTTYHCYVNIDKKVYICFKCDAKGKLAIEYESIPVDVEILRKMAHMNWTKEKVDTFNKWQMQAIPVETSKKQVKNLPVNSSLIWIMSDGETLGGNVADSQATQYLHRRGLEGRDILNLDIRISGEKSGPYKNTIIFPVYHKRANDRDELDYFVCRKYDGTEPKYINAPWSKGDTLYTVNPPSTAYKHSTVVVCEGVFDAIGISKVYPVAALLGKRATVEQLDRLVSMNWKNYLIFLDGDAFTHAVRLKMELDNMIAARDGDAKVGIIYAAGTDPAELALNHMSTLKDLLNAGHTKCKKQ